MIMSFDNPRQVTLMDANPDKSGVLRLPDQQIYSDPSWAGERDDRGRHRAHGGRHGRPD